MEFMAIQAFQAVLNRLYMFWLLSDKQASGVQTLLTVTAKVEAYVALPASLVQWWLYVLPTGFPLHNIYLHLKALLATNCLLIKRIHWRDWRDTLASDCKCTTPS
ncbi:TPA: hypothetical protein ACH3X2_007642 [Trebouxia sp. C0005]